jgi:hypothetical protein
MNKTVIILELASLVRSLDFIQEEQAFIKDKLTSKLEEANDISILNWAEEVHQQILNRELATQLLKKDIAHLDRALKLSSSIKLIEEGNLDKYKNHKEQVQYLEQEFFIWKNKVNQELELANS